MRRELPDHVDTLCGDCGRSTRVGGSAIERWAAFNDILEARGEKPMTRFEVVKCHDCYLAWRGTQTAEALANLDKERAQVKTAPRRNVNEEVLDD